MDLPPFFREKFSNLGKLPFTYRPWLSSVLVTLAGVGVAFVYFQTDTKADVYAQAKTVFTKWEAAPENELLLKQMKIALHKVPVLEKKYEPVIVQKLIEMGKSIEALEMAHHSLKGMNEEAPFHAIFSETSLLIEQGLYQQALERSVGLKEKMANTTDVANFSGDRLIGGAVLYAHNLMRIASLQHALKNKPGEMASWEEFESFLRARETSAVGALILNNFQNKGINLFHYIAERKKEL